MRCCIRRTERSERSRGRGANPKLGLDGVTLRLWTSHVPCGSRHHFFFKCHVFVWLFASCSFLFTSEILRFFGGAHLCQCSISGVSQQGFGCKGFPKLKRPWFQFDYLIETFIIYLATPGLKKGPSFFFRYKIPLTVIMGSLASCLFVPVGSTQQDIRLVQIW